MSAALRWDAGLVRSAVMSLNLRTYTRAVYGFEHVLRLVDGRWDAPTPCTEWTVRHVTGHTTAVVSNVASRAGLGELLDHFGDVAAIAGDDPLGSFRAARDRYLEATDRPDALATPVSSRVGVMSLDRYLAVMACDAVVHTWDLMVALGLPIDLEADLLRFVRDEYRIRDESTMRGPGLYSAAVGAVHDDDLSEILAFTGRAPA